MIKVYWKVLMSDSRFLSTRFDSRTNALERASSPDLKIIVMEDGMQKQLHPIAIVKVIMPNSEKRKLFPHHRTASSVLRRSSWPPPRRDKK